MQHRQIAYHFEMLQFNRNQVVSTNVFIRHLFVLRLKYLAEFVQLESRLVDNDYLLSLKRDEVQVQIFVDKVVCIPR